MRLTVFLILLAVLLSPLHSRSVGVWCGDSLLEPTAAFYEEQEELSGSVVTRMADIKDMAHMDTVYIVAHGWKNTSNDTGGIYIFDVDDAEEAPKDSGNKDSGKVKMPFSVLLALAERAGVRSLVVDTCHAGFVVDAAADRRSTVAVIAGCSSDEVMPVFDGRSLFSLCWAYGEPVPNVAEWYGYVVHPVWR